MGHSQSDKAESRKRILDIASRRFRETGLEGLSIADLMQEAGLTHGGFYKHFESREDLVASALDQAMTETLKRPASTLSTFIDRYLSVEHRDAPGGGCAISALAADVGRSDDRSRAVFTAQLRDGLRRIAKLADEAGAHGNEDAALFQTSAMVGALILARAVDDPKLSAALLKASRNNLKPPTRLAKPRGRAHSSTGAKR